MASNNNNSTTTTAKLKSSKLTIVIKLGTSSICDEKTLFPKLSNLSLLVEVVFKLRNLGHAVVIVSSGAVGVGLKRLNLERRPKHLAQVQAVAAVGQGRLMALYDDLFGRFDIPIAQVLITRENMAERSQYLNACNTFRELLQMNVVPIVNENDTISHAQIRFGDNDTLSAITAGMVNADYLFLCTDVEALYTDNPRTNPAAKRVRVVHDVEKLKAEVTVSSPGSALGTGGMVTKLIAADLATAAGCAMFITIGSNPQRIIALIDEIAAHEKRNDGCEYEPSVGTLFLAKAKPMVDRKWWILHGLATHGVIYVDAGATAAITRDSRSSLFAAGSVRIVTVVRKEAVAEDEGSANRAEAMAADDPRLWESEAEVAARWKGQVVEIGKGIVSYGALEILRVRGCRSSEIQEVLGYVDSDCIVHRNSLSVTHTLGRDEHVVWRRK
ncbi:Aspartate/glutamate/uridylate kinase [Zopfochytrium polystomum]|nr:Aspartate/glutamate/uridylate kinase [Zopfochytrium polystomum]